MAENVNRSALRVSQKRLTIAVAVLGLLGCLALGLIWWDSVGTITAYSSDQRSIFIVDSAIRCGQSLYGLGFPGPYCREKIEIYEFSYQELFPLPVASSSRTVIIPIYLIILAYLATLLLIWLVLTNRLARREFMRQRDA